MDLTPYLQLGGTGFLGFLFYKVVMRLLDVLRNLGASIDKNTNATNELYTYVKVRNGTLERMVQGDPRIKKAAKDAIKKK